MGYIAKLKVFGREWEVQNAEVVYHRFMNPKTGRAGEQPMGGFIYLTLLSGYDDEALVWWMLHSEEGELCKLTQGELSFYKDSFDTPVQFTYSFNDAALVQYKETFSNQGETPMTINLIISPAIQQFKGQTLIKPWQENWVKSIEQLPYQAKEESIEPEILEAYWMDEYMENRIDTAVFTKKATLIVKTANIEPGEFVQLKIRRKDNQSLGGKKYIMYQGVVNEEGQAEMEPLELDENWIKTN